MKMLLMVTAFLALLVTVNSIDNEVEGRPQAESFEATVAIHAESEEKTANAVRMDDRIAERIGEPAVHSPSDDVDRKTEDWEASSNLPSAAAVSSDGSAVTLTLTGDGGAQEAPNSSAVEIQDVVNAVETTDTGNSVPHQSAAPPPAVERATGEVMRREMELQEAKTTATSLSTLGDSLEETRVPIDTNGEFGVDATVMIEQPAAVQTIEIVVEVEAEAQIEEEEEEEEEETEEEVGRSKEPFHVKTKDGIDVLTGSVTADEVITDGGISGIGTHPTPISHNAENIDSLEEIEEPVLVLNAQQAKEHSETKEVSSPTFIRTDDEDGEDEAALLALREIAELQKEELEEANRNEQSFKADAELLRGIEAAESDQASENLKRDHAHFSTNKRDAGGAREVRAGHVTDVKESQEHGGNNRNTEGGGSRSGGKSPLFGNKKRVGAVRSTSSSGGSSHTHSLSPSIQPMISKESLKTNGILSSTGVQDSLEGRLKFGSIVGDGGDGGGGRGDTTPLRKGGVDVGGTIISERSFKARRLPRDVARPVERTLAIYEDYGTSLYDVLGVLADCEDIDIKQAYRSLALEIHPDKNPHPDAKIAFDAIQDAFRTLSTTPARREYDEEHARRNRVTIRRLRKKVFALFHNQFSALQLLHHRLLNGESHELVVELREGLQRKLAMAKEVKVHIQLLPSIVDRFKLLHELIHDHRSTIGPIFVAFVSLL